MVKALENVIKTFRNMCIVLNFFNYFMKKGLLIWLIIGLWTVLSGCKSSQDLDWDWMERIIEYPMAEQVCMENSGQLSTNDEWVPICIFFENDYCYLEDMEDWWCDLLYEEQWWWEWITVVKDMCEEQWWVVEEWNEWWEKQDVCTFEDKSFCYFENLAIWNCEKWDMYYIDDSLEAQLAECDAEWENIVCWTDGNTYYNRCFLEFAWVEEETELAEVVDGECIYG